MVAKGSTEPASDDLDGMTRAELLVEYEYEVTLRDRNVDPAMRRARRAELLDEVRSWRAEREDDMDELLSLPRSELLMLARGLDLEGRRSMTKQELADAILPWY